MCACGRVKLSACVVPADNESHIRLQEISARLEYKLLDRPEQGQRGEERFDLLHSFSGRIHPDNLSLCLTLKECRDIESLCRETEGAKVYCQ